MGFFVICFNLAGLDRRLIRYLLCVTRAYFFNKFLHVHITDIGAYKLPVHLLDVYCTQSSVEYRFCGGFMPAQACLAARF